MNGLDISAAKSTAERQDEGTVVHVHDLADRPMYFGDKADQPVTITVAGAHSGRYRRAEEAIRRRKLNPKKLTGETFHEDNLQKVLACTLGWTGITHDGAPVEVNPHNARMLYEAAPWVLEQVQEAMHDHERFFSKGSPSSPRS